MTSSDRKVHCMRIMKIYLQEQQINDVLSLSLILLRVPIEKKKEFPISLSSIFAFIIGILLLHIEYNKLALGGFRSRDRFVGRLPGLCMPAPSRS